MMKFNVNQSTFQESLTAVMKGVSSRSTLPILSCILVKATEDTLILQSTDLELSIRHRINALIEEPGEVVVSGKLLFEIVKNLPDAAIYVEKNDSSLQIICESSTFSLKTFAAQDFPEFPAVEVSQKFKIPFPLFSSMVKKVSRVVSRDESRPVLAGILITAENTLIKMVATDSYRLAITEAEMENPVLKAFSVVISGSFLSEIASLMKTEDEVTIAFSENQIVVNYQDVEFVNRRIEGNYPNYGQLLPNSYITRVQIDTEKFVLAARRVSLIGANLSPLKLQVNKESQTLQVSTVVQDVGDAKEELDCIIEGEDITIAFDFAYILNGLGSIKTEKLFFETQDAMKPGIFKAGEDDNLLYLVMPVRL